MNDNNERLAIVESKVSTHADEIRRMRESAHEHDNLLTAMQATLSRIEESNSSAMSDFKDHMDREEKAFGNLYDRLKRLDESLILAFKERDEKIHVLDKGQVKLLAYATAAFAAITILVRVLL